jgi:hypothetical protein
VNELINGLDNLGKLTGGSTATFGNGSIGACAAVVNDRGNQRPGHTVYGYFKELGLIYLRTLRAISPAKAGCGKSARLSLRLALNHLSGNSLSEGTFLSGTLRTLYALVWFFLPIYYSSHSFISWLHGLFRVFASQLFTPGVSSRRSPLCKISEQSRLHR